MNYCIHKHPIDTSPCPFCAAENVINLPSRTYGAVVLSPDDLPLVLDARHAMDTKEVAGYFIALKPGISDQDFECALSDYVSLFGGAVVTPIVLKAAVIYKSGAEKK